MKPLAVILSIIIGVGLSGCARQENSDSSESRVETAPPPPAPVAKTEPEAASGASTITRNGFRMKMLQGINDDPELKNDPVKADFALCMSLTMEDEIFNGPMALTEDEFKARMKASMERMNEGIKNSEDAFMRQGVSCMLAAQAGTVRSQLEAGEATPTGSASLPPLMDMDDLRLDFASLEGRDVLVKGIGVYMMEMFQLKKSVSDMSPIFVDISGLPREERKKVLSKCGDFMSGCRIQIHGTVGSVLYQRGLIAKNIYW